MEKKLHTVLTIRLFTDEKCFGPGIATLLHHIEDLHSLRSASMKMTRPHPRGCTTARSAEAQLAYRQLHPPTGGRHGGGATLTEEARELLTAYDGFCRELQETADALYEKYFSKY